MRKNSLLLMLLFAIFNIFVINFSFNDVNNQRYETMTCDLTDDELMDYYIENKIFPSNIYPEASEKLIDGRNISSHLTKRFSNYNNWTKTSNIKFVSNTYGNNPSELSQEYDFILKAKEMAGLNYEFVGCGPTAMISQFEYLAKCAECSQISKNIEDSIIASEAPNRVRLAKEVLSSTYAIPSESTIGQIVGATPGTFTFPSSVISASKKILENHLLLFEKTRTVKDKDGNEKIESYYADGSMIKVYGDIVPNILPYSTKINNLKDSIDRGMPVIWWTMGKDLAGAYANHYMNIYGYEYWMGTDSSGKTKEHLMFVINCNWDDSFYYVDSDAFYAANGGFIYFEETHDRTKIQPENYGYDCQYYYDVRFKNNIKTSDGSYINTSYLRAGYVNRYNKDNTKIIGQELVLSGKKENVGCSYIEYEFKRNIDWIYLELSWWSSKEGINFINGSVLVQYKNSKNNWVTRIDLLNSSKSPLSVLIDSKSRHVCALDEPSRMIRIIVTTSDTTGDRNKGRLVIGEIDVGYIKNSF